MIESDPLSSLFAGLTIALEAKIRDLPGLFQKQENSRSAEHLLLFIANLGQFRRIRCLNQESLMNKIKILAIPGSLRKASLIRQLLLALQPLAPEDMEIAIFDLHGIPMYNQDVEDTVGYPPPVQELRDAIESSDGLILATPEYNGSITGVLKNSIDWASRKGLMAKRPVTPITGTPGALGGTKAQVHLRSVMSHLGMCVLSRPALAVPYIDQKIENGLITDEQTQKFITHWLKEFKEWILQLNK